MKRTIITSLVLTFLVLGGFVGIAAAQVPPVACPKPTDPAPTKKLKIYNNNPTNGSNIYVFFSHSYKTRTRRIYGCKHALK